MGLSAAQHIPIPQMDRAGVGQMVAPAIAFSAAMNCLRRPQHRAWRTPADPHFWTVPFLSCTEPRAPRHSLSLATGTGILNPEIFWPWFFFFFFTVID